MRIDECLVDLRQKPKPSWPMYPTTFFGLFPPFPRSHRVFVAMSFAPEFQSRWEKVLTPAIMRVSVNGQALEPHRVDLRNAGDSILTEILDEIARCRLFIADVSTIGSLSGRPIRNSNVFYELGLAHAVRLPEEVIVIRDDGEQLPFDVANVRIHEYRPNQEPDVARNKVEQLIQQALREVDLRESIAIRRAIESTDYTAWKVLGEASGANGMPHPMRPDQRKEFGLIGLVPRLVAIDRLVSMGALRSQFNKLSAKMIALGEIPLAQDATAYHLTEFGKTLYERCAEEQGFYDADVRAAINAAKIPQAGGDPMGTGGQVLTPDSRSARLTVESGGSEDRPAASLWERLRTLARRAVRLGR